MDLAKQEETTNLAHKYSPRILIWQTHKHPLAMAIQEIDCDFSIYFEILFHFGVHHTSITWISAAVDFMFISILRRQRLFESINVATSIKSFVYRIFLWESKCRNWNGNDSGIVEEHNGHYRETEYPQSKVGKITAQPFQGLTRTILRLLESGLLTDLRSKKAAEMSLRRQNQP